MTNSKIPLSVSLVLPFLPTGPRAKFKTGGIGLFVKDYISKLQMDEFENGRIILRSLQGKKGQIESYIQNIIEHVANTFILIAKLTHLQVGKNRQQQTNNSWQQIL